jgi:hypothetical protein
MLPALTVPLWRTLLFAAGLLWLGTAYGPLFTAGFHGHDLELLVRAGGWQPQGEGFGPRAVSDFAPIEVLAVVGDDLRGDVGSLLSGLWLILSLRLWGAVDGQSLGLPSAFFYRFENLALLLVAGLGLWRFLRRLFAPWVGADQAARGAAAAALMFVVHPLCVPTVASLAGRSDLMSLAFATWAGTCFLVGRQERLYLALVVAGGLALLAGLSGEIALALPPALAAAEFLSAGRHRPLRVRLRTGFNTLLIYSVCVQLNTALVSTTTGHGYYPRVSYDLAGLLEPGAIVQALGNVLGKVGVLCLPANLETLGPLGAVLALVLLLAALQPALVAARSAPRLWTGAFAFWVLASAFALLFGLEKPVDLGNLGDAVSLVPATLVVCAGLGLCCTAASGLGRVALPLALSFGYASLSNGNAQPWAESARRFSELRRDVAAALADHPDAQQVVVVDSPRAVRGVDPIEDGLPWIQHPMFTGAAVERPEDLEPLAIRDLSPAAFATWVRRPEFAAERAGGTLLLHPRLEAQSGEGPGTPRSWRRLAPPSAGGGPSFWSGASRSPDLELDALGPAVLRVVAPAVPVEQLPQEAHWRGFGGATQVGQVPLLWLDGAEGPTGWIDAGEDLAWRLGERIVRVWFESGLPTVREVRVGDGLPVPEGVGPPQDSGSGWRFDPPRHEVLAEQPEGRWRLRALALPSLAYTEAEARRPRAGSPLRFSGLARWAEPWLRAGEAVVYELEYVCGGLPALRALGRVEPPAAQ